MAWFRSAMSKAVEVGNKNNLTRAVRNYTDSVVHHAGQAVAEGAKIIQDRMSGWNVRSVKQTIKRLEEAAVSYQGPERVELLRRWLTVLKDIERFSGSTPEDKDKNVEQNQALDDSKYSPRSPSMVLYYDPEVGGRPMNFRDVFLQSQALEGITLSMILEPPNEEEISLLLDMFGICLTGGKDVHNAIVSSVQDLAQSFSGYEDEVLVKREELLQFAQSAISGLKINFDIARIDAEAFRLKKKLDELDAAQKDANGENPSLVSIEELKEALTRVRICSRLESLLTRKKTSGGGDSAEIHAQKVDKLKILSESLASSITKSEKRIADYRTQKNEALQVRATKASEAGDKEKEISAEIAEFEKQRDHLEAELKKVNISLAAAQSRLRNVVEERDQFNEANNQIVAHMKTKEAELSNSIASCKTEAEVLHTWINFLEDTWVLQCTHTEVRDRQANEMLDKHEDYFMNLAFQLLSAYKKELGPSVSRIGKFVENLKNLSGSSEVICGSENESKLHPRKHLEEEYLDYEAKIVTTFNVVDNIKAHLYSQQDQITRKDNQKVKALIEEFDKLRSEFEAIERPILEIEAPAAMESPPSEMPSETPLEHSTQETVVHKVEETTQTKVASPKADPALDAEAELANLESEFGKVGHDYSAEEIGDWEFDELERELRSGDSKSGQ
ncbi:hypothetical protein MLD38_024176 [Melastoma candidum]|uniref:Uncharacterized protein n=1 Tax=Melastoma candidum TaxID=119954 RepID=A0ACB9NUH7_9MYRT|nr:hypothetical protein MLD38_024176 [Melastoma candidum]